MKCIGIDIGTFSIKVFTVEAKSKELHLLDYEEHELSTSPTADNQVLILDILKKISEKNDSEKTKFIFSLPQSQVSSRHRRFPFKERSKVYKTIPFELEDDIPFDLDESAFDAKFVCFNKAGAEVIASATPKKNVLDIIELAQSVGIDPDIVTTQGLALANLVEDFNTPPPLVTKTEIEADDEEEAEVQPEQSGHAMVSIGHSSTLVMVFREFRLVAVHSISWGGSDVAEGIAKRYRLQQEEALKELQSKAFVLTQNDGATKDQVIFSETISNSLSTLIRDLKLFLLGIQTEFNIKLSHIALTGGTSQIRNLAPFLSQKIGFPVNTFDPYERFPATHVDLTPQTKAISGLSLALAIEGVRRPANPATNFRQGDLVKQSQVLKVFWERWGHAARLAMIALLCLYVYAFAKSFFADTASSSASSKLSRQAKSLGLKGRQARPRGIKNYLRQKNKEMKSRDSMHELLSAESALDLIARLSDSAPSKRQIQLDIKQFLLTNETLAITGSVADPNQLKSLEDALKSMSKNGQVKGSKTASPSSSMINFQYSLSVDRNFPVARKSKRKRGSQ